MAKQERSRRTYEQVLDAAAAEFAQYGYSDANLQRVVDRTGLTKGALYGHFARKEDLAEALSAHFSLLWEKLVSSTDGAASGLAALRCLTLALAREVESDLRTNAGLRLALDTARAEPEGPDLPGRMRSLARRTVGAPPSASPAGGADGCTDPDRAGALGDLALVLLVGAYYTDPAVSRQGMTQRMTALWDAIAGAPCATGQKAG